MADRYLIYSTFAPLSRLSAPPGVRHFSVLHQVCRMNSALHGASLSPVNVIPAKAGIQAPGLFLVLKTTPDKTHVVPVERVPGKTGKWNPGPRYRHINHAGHRRGASGFRPGMKIPVLCGPLGCGRL